MVIASALGVRLFPYTLPTTLGMREKKPPEPKPFITMNATSGAMLDDAGQIVSMLSALMVSARTRAVIGPTESPNTPKPTRPTADAML